MTNAQRSLTVTNPTARGRLTVLVLAWLCSGVAAGLADGSASAAAEDDVASVHHALATARADVARLNGELASAVNGTSTLASTQVAQLPANYAAQVEIRLVELERRLQTLTGEVEQLGYRLSQAEGRLERALNDIDYRLTTLEGGEPVPSSTGSGGAATGATTTLPADMPETTYIGPEPSSGPGVGGRELAPGTGVLGTLVIQGDPSVPRNPSFVEPAETFAVPDPQTAVLPSGNVQERYDHAYGLLQRGDFPGAELAFRQFLERHDGHALASNAHYWLGETYYARSRFDDAAAAFAQGYRAYPRGAKAVDSLLKLGMSLAQLGRTEDACVTFEQLSTEFPTGPVAIQRRADQERERLQCR